jgi:uncharacterized protein (TIGR02147 family)
MEVLKDDRHDYRSQLQSELRRRQVVNPRFSMRAFARTLGLSPAFLSKLLRGQKGLSTRNALAIADRLGYSDDETARFCQLVQLSAIRDSRLRDRIEAGSEGGRDRHDFVPLGLDEFHSIADWHHYAILELLETRDARSEAGWIAARLGIRRDEAESALERLTRLGLIVERRGRLVKAERYVATPSEIPSGALREFHTQQLELAKRALGERAIGERDITGVTIAIDPAKLEEAKAEVRRFRRRLARLLDGSGPTEVYHLAIQLYPLSRPAPEKGLLQ